MQNVVGSLLDCESKDVRVLTKSGSPLNWDRCTWVINPPHRADMLEIAFDLAIPDWQSALPTRWCTVPADGKVTGIGCHDRDVCDGCWWIRSGVLNNPVRKWPVALLTH